MGVLPSMTDHAVVIAGGGPTGLMLAGELALAGVDVAIVERRVNQDVDGSRAGGLLSRSIEVLDQRGIAERFLEAGYLVPAQGYAGITLDISDFPTRHNYVLALWQSKFEPILADWIGELGVPSLRGREVVGFAQDDNGVDVEISDGQTLRAEYLVGCDGGRSLIRRRTGIDFAGLDPSTSWIIAEVKTTELPEVGMRPEGGGIGPAGDGESARAVLMEQHVEHSDDPSIDDLREALVAIYGTDYGVHSPTWISRFTDMTRQAASYRQGRVLLAGDAAHVHPPHGGQGLNTGVQDAVNLGWKLAQVVKGTSPETLLDTYHAERHPVGARVLHNTMAQVALLTPGDRHQALRDTMKELLGMDEPRRRIAAMLSGLDIHYDLGDGHPLLGRRMPDLDLQTADGPTRVFTLLHDARPVLLNLGEPGDFDISPWANRVRLIDATHVGVWELPVLGEVAAPPAVLIRPDGHVAWAGDLTDPQLPRALATWFGAPQRPVSKFHPWRRPVASAFMATHWTLGCDAIDPQSVARFWAGALGYVGEPGFDGPDSASIVDPDGHGPAIGFLRVPEGKTAKNRMHIDIRVAGEPPWDMADREQLIRAKVHELTLAGATWVREEFYEEHLGHVVMLDPEGNEFCVA